MTRVSIPEGTRFGKLTVLGEGEGVPRPGNGMRRYFRCRCDCGTEEVLVQLDLLRSGKTTSCGCARRRRTAQFNTATKTTHGLRKHELYNTWNLIRERCTNPQWKHFADYGGRGVGLHQPWLDPAVFIAEIEQHIGSRPAGMTLDRIDNDGNYEPGNVRWATPAQQAVNQRPRRTLRSAALPPRDVLFTLGGVAPSSAVLQEVVNLLG